MALQTHRRINSNYNIKKRLSLNLRRFVRGKKMRLDNYDNEILRYIVLSRTDFREYIEHQFLEGMTWDNYCSVWEIDHIIPVGEFDMANEDDLKLCWHYLNLMPLTRKDNEIKAHSLYFAKIELEKRLKVLPSNPILKALKEKTNNEEIHTKYNYDLEFLKFYNSIKYH